MKQEYLNIGALAKASGVKAKMIRYYESVGILPEAKRDTNNYRIYLPSDVDTLKFIKNAKALSFDFEDIRKLLQLYSDENRQSAEVKALTLKHIDFITERIEEMEEVKETLTQLAERCAGDRQPDCLIIDSILKK